MRDSATSSRRTGRRPRLRHRDGFRYRVNVLQQRGFMGVVMRLIPPNVPPFERLNLPQKVLELADEERGLILVTGCTGFGKVHHPGRDGRLHQRQPSGPSIS